MDHPSEAVAELLAAEADLAAVVADLRFPWRPPAEYWPHVGRWCRALEQLARAELRETAASGDRVPLAPEGEPPEWLSRPIFVVGALRSGTTLFRDLLDGHPQVLAILVESTYLTVLRPRFRHLPQPERLLALGVEWAHKLACGHSRPPFFLLGRSRAGDLPSLRFVLAVVRWAKARIAAGRAEEAACLEAFAVALSRPGRDSGPLFWVEKTPGHEEHAELLLSAFPGARIVHVLRDPLAVLRSRAALEQATGEGHWHPAAGALELRRAYRTALAGAVSWPDRYRVVRYEDLVADRVRTVRRLAGELDLPWHESLLEPSRSGARVGRNSSHPGTGAATGERRLVGAASRHLAGIAPALGYQLPRPGLFERAAALLLGPVERLCCGLPGLLRRARRQIGGA